MKVTKIIIRNVGLVSDETIEVNKPLIIFYGSIRAGKSTILNAVRWVTGGNFPDDIIKHGEKEASITLELDGGIISRSWYRNKEGVTTPRALTFIKNGKPVPSPFNEIKRLLNPFLLDQDYLVKMGETDRKKFFAELFAVDTTEIDKAIFNADQQARSLRSKLTGYGDIDVTPVEPVDEDGLRKELQSIRATNTSASEAHNKQLAEVAEHNATVDRGVESRKTQEAAIAALEQQLKDAKSKLEATNKWLTANPKKSPPQPLALASTEQIEQRLSQAAAQNVRVEQYKANLKRQEQKTADENALTALEKTLREQRAAKVAKLKEITANCPIKGLAFDEDGSFVYEETQSSMLSTSQLMKLSHELSSMYPEGLGIELLDRGESLGKSIFGFIDRATRENKTILATVVGEKPAVVPENVGVFIVENGKVTK